MYVFFISMTESQDTLQLSGLQVRLISLSSELTGLFCLCLFFFL